MKHNINWFRGLVACGAALAVVSTVCAQDQQVTAKVVHIKGDARYSTGNNVWKDLKVNDVLKAGTIIQTGVGEGSYVDIVLGEGEGAVFSSASTVAGASSASGQGSSGSMKFYESKANQSAVRLTKNTALGLDKLTVAHSGDQEITDSELDLKLGRIYFNVKKLTVTSKFEIKLPNGVAGIRGSSGYADTANGGQVGMFTGESLYSHTTADNSIKTEDIKAGFKFSGDQGAVDPLSSQDVQQGHQNVPTVNHGGNANGGGTTGGNNNNDHTAPIDNTKPAVTQNQ